MFHMPLFCICSGLFAKFKNDRIIKYCLIYMVSQTLLGFLRIITPWETVTLRTVLFPYFHMWYLYVLILWICMIPFLDKIIGIHTSMRIIIMFSILMVALAGGNINFSSYLGTNRLISFAPLFYFAYIYKKEFFTLVNFLSLKLSQLSVCFFILLSIIVTIIVSPIININSFYNDLTYAGGGYSWMERLLFYILGTIMTIIIWLYFRGQKIYYLLSKIGQKTMWIFVSHAFVYYIVKYTLYKRIDSMYLKCLIAFVFTMICVAIPMMISLNKQKGK